MNDSIVVRLDDEFNYYLQQICNKYKDLTGKRLPKQIALMRLISRDAYLYSFCISAEAKEYFKLI